MSPLAELKCFIPKKRCQQQESPKDLFIFILSKLLFCAEKTKVSTAQNFCFHRKKLLFIPPPFSIEKQDSDM